MSILAIQKPALGRAVISKQATCATATNFTYQQNQVDTLTSTATAGYSISISMKLKATNIAAQDKYGYELTKPFQVFTTPFDTTPHVTAAALAVLIQAAFPLLLVTETGGVITISTNGNYGLEIQYEYTRFLTRESVSVPVDLTTYTGEAILLATVSGANVRYSEAPVASVTPTASVGLLVEDGNPFDIVGNDNIMNCQFIQASATALVDYTIYI